MSLLNLEEYEKLNDEQKTAIDAIVGAATGESVRTADSDCIDLLGECDGCVPEGFEDELEQNIILKFYLLYHGAMNRVGLGMEIEGHVEIYVQPSYEDACCIIVLKGETGTGSKGWTRDWAKAWHVGFANLADLATRALMIGNEMKAELLKEANR